MNNPHVQKEEIEVPETQARPIGRRRPRLAASAVLLLVGLGGLGYWMVNRWTHVYVVDSRIAANVVVVSSEAAGRVTAVNIVAGDHVSAGDLLVHLETRQAELRLEEIDAEIARIDAEQDHLRAQQAKVRGEIASKLNAGNAEIKAAEAEHRAVETILEAADRDYRRASSLRKSALVSERQFEEQRSRFETAQQQEKRTSADIEAARAASTVIEAEAAEITVLESQIAALGAEKEAMSARRASQLVELGFREIRAAFDGVVDATFVDVGEYVAPGTRVLMYHDPTKVWVEANVKETEFRKLSLGATATVTVDAYPGREFSGEVARLGFAATSQFALLPSPNPSGNFTKVTQRLPLRIAVEQDEGLLRPGMMVEVVVDVVD